MRRYKQLLSEKDSKEILHRKSHGIISLIDPEGEPYGVPINYVYDGKQSIYFHTAVSGYKLDCINANISCSFCVVDQDMIQPKEFTSYFRSVIAKGTIHIVSDDSEIIKGLLMLCNKYSPGIDPCNEISKCIHHVSVLRLDIESMTGKESIELIRKHKNR